MNNPIDRALAFLAGAQSPDGSFESFAFFDTAGTYEKRHTTFHTSLIVLCLSAIPPSQDTARITANGALFLLDQTAPQWSCNYWKKDSPEYTGVRCPDDLDDTSLALAAIAITDRPVITEGAMVAILGHFVTAESTPGGPYNTWILPEYRGTPWEDTDPTVNSNSAYFLSLYDISLPGLVAYIEECIVHNRFDSTYYRPVATIYSIARWYHGPHAALLLDRLCAYDLEAIDDIPHLAMALSSLVRLGGPAERINALLDKLISLQHADGSWDIGPAYVEQIKSGNPQYSGSVALSTAFAIESICLARSKSTGPHVDKGRLLAEALGRRAKRRFGECTEAIAALASSTIDRIIEKDRTNEVALLARRFALATHYAVPRATWVTLGVTNILGWVGYTILDKVLDGEDAIAGLPLSTICIREVATSFHTMLPDRPSRMVRGVLDEISGAHEWEHASCRLARTPDGLRIPETLPSYGDLRVLAQKSLGHALGPLAVIYLHEHKHTASYAKLVRSFFECYLIARQLNDDAHDWENDLKSGFVNSVSVQLVAALQTEDSCDELVTEHYIERLRTLFWDTFIVNISAQIQDHTTRAREMLAQMPFITDQSTLVSLLTPIERAAQKALDERASILRFLDAYEERDSTSATSDSSAPR